MLTAVESTAQKGLIRKWFLMNTHFILQCLYKNDYVDNEWSNINPQLFFFFIKIKPLLFYYQFLIRVITIIFFIAVS